jgi:alpha,alpha-trehalose phosphorylase
LAFKLLFRGRELGVEVEHEQATYTLLSGDELTIQHYGEAIKLEPGKGHQAPIPRLRGGQAPVQPPGRAPAHRRPLPAN